MGHTYRYYTGDEDALKMTSIMMGMAGADPARCFDLAMTVLINISVLSGLKQEPDYEGPTIGDTVDQSIAFCWDTKDGAPAKALEKNMDMLMKGDEEMSLLVALLAMVTQDVKRGADDDDEHREAGS